MRGNSTKMIKCSKLLSDEEYVYFIKERNRKLFFAHQGKRDKEGRTQVE